MKYLQFLFSPKGTVTRLEFLFLLILSLVQYVISFILVDTFKATKPEIIELFLGFIMVASITFAIMRRLRDMGYSPWFTLGHFMPFVNVVLLAFLLFHPSWNKKRGLRYLFTLCKQLAECDGAINRHESLKFEKFCENELSAPEHRSLLKRTVVTFEGGAINPLFGFRYNLEQFISKGNPDFSEKMFIYSLLLGIAEADGVVSKEETALLVQVEKAFNLANELPPGFDHLMGMFYRITKADGVIDKTEINLIEDFFKYAVGLNEKQRKTAIQKFNDTRFSNKTFVDFTNEFYSALKHNKEIIELTMAFLIELASIDGDIHPQEAKMLDQAGAIFNISSNSNYENTYQEQAEQTHYKSKEAQYASILGVSVDAPLREIKIRYTKLLVINHPDKVASMSDVIKKAAAEETKKIIEAYEYFKDMRSSAC
ncbi:MAG: TerB family tellurite resistance protein [Paraglaciecola sp.]|uniref:TerB family tellurite resistance protein n=1 Tax=Paraglaciecola sp. TaxID=1920173 RepID=UPI003298BC66